MPTAVANAAVALNEASIIVDVRMDFEVANLRALVMACIASVVAFEEAVASSWVMAAPSPPTSAAEASVPPYVIAIVFPVEHLKLGSCSYLYETGDSSVVIDTIASCPTRHSVYAGVAEGMRKYTKQIKPRLRDFARY